MGQYEISPSPSCVDKEFYFLFSVFIQMIPFLLFPDVGLQNPFTNLLFIELTMVQSTMCLQKVQCLETKKSWLVCDFKTRIK